MERPEAVLFAAGRGTGSGPERKLTVDRDGAIKLLYADVPHNVIVSSIGAEAPPPGMPCSTSTCGPRRTRMLR